MSFFWEQELPQTAPAQLHSAPEPLCDAVADRSVRCEVWRCHRVNHLTDLPVLLPEVCVNVKLAGKGPVASRAPEGELGLAVVLDDVLSVKRIVRRCGVPAWRVEAYFNSDMLLNGAFEQYSHSRQL